MFSINIILLTKNKEIVERFFVFDRHFFESDCFFFVQFKHYSKLSIFLTFLAQKPKWQVSFLCSTKIRRFYKSNWILKNNTFGGYSERFPKKSLLGRGVFWENFPNTSFWRGVFREGGYLQWWGVIVKPEGCRIGLESSKNHKKWSFWGRFGGPKMVLWVGTNIQKWPWAAVSTCKMCLRHCISLILFLKCCWDHKERVRYSQCGLVTSRKLFNVKWSWNWKIRKYYLFWVV